MKFKKPNELPFKVSAPQLVSTAIYHKKSFSTDHNGGEICNVNTKKERKRFPFEVFSAGMRSNTRSKRKLANVFSVPNLNLPSLPMLKSTVNFEEMERLKNECRQIIHGSGPIIDYGKKKQSLPLISRKDSIVLSPSNLKPSIPIILREGKLPFKSPKMELHPMFSLKKPAEQFRQTAFFKSVIESPKHVGGKNRRTEAVSAPIKKTFAVRVKLEKDALKKQLKILYYNRQKRNKENYNNKPLRKHYEDKSKTEEEFTFADTGENNTNI